MGFSKTRRYDKIWIRMSDGRSSSPNLRWFFGLFVATFLVTALCLAESSKENFDSKSARLSRSAGVIELKTSWCELDSRGDNPMLSCREVFSWSFSTRLFFIASSVELREICGYMDRLRARRADSEPRFVAMTDIQKVTGDMAGRRDLGRATFWRCSWRCVLQTFLFADGPRTRILSRLRTDMTESAMLEDRRVFMMVL